jgi:hypothetical protein
MSININKRVFGDDILPNVKEKLKARQTLASAPAPLDSLQMTDGLYNSNFTDSGDNILFDLSSRTPFARIWTAVEIRTHTFDEELDEMPPEADKSDNKIYIWNDNKKVDVKNVDSFEKIVYEIGNHNVGIFSKSPNERISSENQFKNSSKILPNVFESNNNEFDKPAAGITSITSGTEGALGTIKKTTVNFVIHNFHDYDKIYSRYFLKPGAQIFIDFGWDTATLYDPRNLIDDTARSKLKRGNTLEDILFGDTGYVTESNGDLETLIGFVTAFDSKINANGSVECSLEVISKNAALLQHDYGGSNKLKNRIMHLLDSEVINFAAKHFTAFKDNELLDPNWTNSAESINDFNKVAQLFAASNLKGIQNIPTEKSTLTGVYWQEAKNASGETLPGNTKNIYISWGLFEDKILNGEFGIGTDLVSILGHNAESGNFESRFDSSNTFIRWDKNLFLRQKSEKDPTKLSFIYPHNWDTTYNSLRGKIPTEHKRAKNVIKKAKNDAERYSRFEAQYDPGDTNENARTDLDSTSDLTTKRIPFRELFISLKEIKNAFNTNTTISDALNSLLKTINSDSYDIFNLQLSNTRQDATQISIIDRNFVYVDNGTDSADFFDNLFIFKPLSPNSIIKSYNLSISTSKDELQSMIAIQSLPTGKKLFPLTSVVDKYLAMKASNLDKHENSNNTNQEIGVIYLPEIGSYSGNKIEENNSLDNSISFNFNKDSIFTEQVNSINTSILDQYSETFGGIKDEAQLRRSIDRARDPAEVVKDGDSDNSTDIDDNQQEELSEDVKIASTIAEYYGFIAKKNFVVDSLPTIIPATLSLSIYGISSLIPGDILRVDYLPERQRELIYFQITKVSHNIGTSTWTTEIETVPRVRAKQKSKSGLYYKPKEITLTKAILDDLKLFKIDNFNGHNIKKFIKKLKITDVSDKLTEFDWIMRFESKVDQEINVNALPGGTKVNRKLISQIKSEFIIREINSKIVDSDEWFDYFMDTFSYDIKLKIGSLYNLLIIGREWIIVPYYLSDSDLQKINNFFIKVRETKQGIINKAAQTDRMVTYRKI